MSNNTYNLRSHGPVPEGSVPESTMERENNNMVVEGTTADVPDDTAPGRPKSQMVQEQDDTKSEKTGEEDLGVQVSVDKEVSIGGEEGSPNATAHPSSTQHPPSPFQLNNSIDFSISESVAAVPEAVSVREHTINLIQHITTWHTTCTMLIICYFFVSKYYFSYKNPITPPL